MIREGNVAVQAREEEIRFLNMHGQEEQRGIDVLRKALPNKRNLERELVTLQIQVDLYFMVYACLIDEYNFCCLYSYICLMNTVFIAYTYSYL